MILRIMMICVMSLYNLTVYIKIWILLKLATQTKNTVEYRFMEVQECPKGRAIIFIPSFMQASSEFIQRVSEAVRQKPHFILKEKQDL